MRRVFTSLAACVGLAMFTPAYAAPPLDLNAVRQMQPNMVLKPTERPPVQLQGYQPGTIVISSSERRLFYIEVDGKARAYPIGVGKIGFTWAGITAISAKKEWPGWTPPSDMLRRRPDLPRYMAGGLNNPLGARAMYLGSTLYRIHGSNEPDTIGQAVSSGCFRMHNRDVIELYNKVSVGTKVVVLR